MVTKTSYWLASTDTPAFHHKLSDVKKVDVIIVGGGIAGITTAFLLSQSGKKVCILEADEILKGVTGHTTAHVTVAHELIYSSLNKKFGFQYAKDYAGASTSALEKIQENVTKFKIKCDFNRVNEFVFGATKQDKGTIKEEFELSKKIGLSVSLLDEAPLPFETFGAVKYSDQALYHPRKYLLALAKEIIKKGGYIVQHARVTSVSEGEPCIVYVGEKKVQATDIVIATHYPILDRALFFTKLVPYRSYVYGCYIKEDLGLQMFDSSEDPSHYFRTHPTSKGNLLIAGGEDHITGHEPDTNRNYALLEDYIRTRFTVKEIAYRWSSQDTYTFDRLPLIGPYMKDSKHMFVASGFNGWGMTNGTLSGILLHDAIMNKKNSYAYLYDPHRFSLPQSIGGMAQFTLDLGKTILNKSKFNNI